MSDDLARLQAALAERYSIERELGRGGMAVVYLARDERLGRPVALKVLRPELAASLGTKRFLREIEIAAGLTHPNILALHDRGEADGVLYYTMPYVEGGSLRELLDREKQLPIEDCLRIAGEVADALSHAHSLGIVHRDIKPENILFQGGHAVVSDFGIARAVAAAGGESLTDTGIAVGTPWYMSPEQAAATGDIDARSDIYSLACVLFELIGGEPPYTGPSAQAILARHSLEAIPVISIIRAGTPPGIERALTKALAKNPADRFRTAAQFREALAAPDAMVEDQTAPRPAPKPTPRVWRLGAGLGVTALIAVGIWQLFTPAADTTVTRDGIAILPFDVQGDLERPLDGTSIAMMLRTYFSYTERYRPAAPELVRQAVAQLCPAPPVERFCGTRVATELGAQYHLTGLVTPIRGDSVSITTYLVDEVVGRTVPVTVAGSRTEPYPLVDALYRQLAVASAGAGERVVQLAGINTENPAALAAFLDGELHFADFRLGEAWQSFEHAVEADSTFALAWYRIAVLADWDANPPAMRNAIARARQYGDRLSEHDRRMLDAAELTHEGYADSAETILLGLIEEDDSDVEALFQLGLLRWAYNWRRGRSMAEAREPLGRVLELAPRHVSAAIYQLFALAAAGDVDALDSLGGSYAGEAPEVAQAVRAYRSGDTVRFAAALDSLQGPGVAVTFTKILLGTVHGTVPDLTALTGRLWELDSVESSHPAERSTDYLWIARWELSRGHWRAAREALQTAASLWTSYLAEPTSIANATLPIPTLPEVAIDSLLAVIGAWSVPRDTLFVRSRPGVLHYTTREYDDVIPLYLAGLLESLRSGYDAALDYADSLEALHPHRTGYSTALDLAQGVRADVFMRQGRPQAALDALDRAPWAINYNEVFFAPAVGGMREMFLRARALQELGRYEDALKLYTYGVELPFIFLAPSHLYRGEIYERLGDRERAAWHYSAFVELWRDADPESQVLVADARRRLARLAAEPR